MQESFCKLCNVLPNNCTLYVPCVSDTFVIECDASYKGIGAVLYVHRDGRELPVGFHSRSLRGAEARYSASEVECLAVVDSVCHFEVYLQGTEFKIRTDHKALIAVKKNAILNSRLIRWSLFLQQFHFNIEHKPGKMNLVTDVLSRQNWTGGGGGIIKKDTLESPREGD